MAISTTDSKRQYNGNGATTSFSFPYYFFADTDLVVIKTNTSTLVDTTQTLTTHYTISGSPTGGPYLSGANVVMVTAPTSQERLTITRVLTYTQAVDYLAADPFPAETHERALDRLTMLTQQLKEELSRVIKFPASTLLSDLTFPAAVANKLIGWNAAATALENKDFVASTLVLPAFTGKAGYIVIVNSAENSFDYGIALTTKGDLLTRTSSAYARLGVGTNNYVLAAASGETTGLIWATVLSLIGMTAKGDLVTRSASANAVLGVGSNGQVLTANSAATNGIEWSTPTAAPVAATQAEMETASSTAVFVTPGRIKYAPGYQQVGINFDGTGTPSIRYSWGVSSLVDNGTGLYRINFSESYSTNTKVVPNITGMRNTGGGSAFGQLEGSATYTDSVDVAWIDIAFKDEAGSNVDVIAGMVTVSGDL